VYGLGIWLGLRLWIAYDYGWQGLVGYRWALLQISSFFSVGVIVEKR